MRTKMERIAAIVVLAIIVTAALIAAIVGTAASSLRFLGAIGLLSLIGLLRHVCLLVRSTSDTPRQSLAQLEAVLESEVLSSGTRAALQVELEQRLHAPPGTYLRSRAIRSTK